MKKAKVETAIKKQVFRDQKQICNYGHMEYLRATKGIHTLSKPFYDGVKRLPVKYDRTAYENFIDYWGTVSRSEAF